MTADSNWQAIKGQVIRIDLNTMDSIYQKEARGLLFDELIERPLHELLATATTPAEYLQVLEDAIQKENSPAHQAIMNAVNKSDVDESLKQNFRDTYAEKQNFVYAVLQKMRDGLYTFFEMAKSAIKPLPIVKLPAPDTPIEEIQRAIKAAVLEYRNWYYKNDETRGTTYCCEKFFFHGEYGQEKARKLLEQVSQEGITTERAINYINLFLAASERRFRRHSAASFVIDHLKALKKTETWYGLACDTETLLYEKRVVQVVARRSLGIGA